MTSWRAELVERVARRLCQLDGADPEAWAGYLDDANAAADILIPAILERAAEVAEKAMPPAHTYASENADIYRAQDHARDRIVTAIRSLKDNPESTRDRD